MAIKINKPITRELQLTQYNYKGQTRPMIVTLTENETLMFRPKGTRHVIEVDLSHCVNLAEIFSVDDHYRREMEKYKKGIRQRKPKRCHYPYSKVYFRAIDSVKTKCGVC